MITELENCVTFDTAHLICASTIQTAMTRLRKEHNLAISASVAKGGWRCTISKIKLDSDGFIVDGVDVGNMPTCATYEAACETAIGYCLKYLI